MLRIFSVFSLCLLNCLSAFPPKGEIGKKTTLGRELSTEIASSGMRWENRKNASVLCKLTGHFPRLFFHFDLPTFFSYLPAALFHDKFHITFRFFFQLKFSAWLWLRELRTKVPGGSIIGFAVRWMNIVAPMQMYPDSYLQSEYHSFEFCDKNFQRGMDYKTIWHKKVYSAWKCKSLWIQFQHLLTFFGTFNMAQKRQTNVQKLW